MEKKHATLIAHDLVWSLSFYSQYQQLKAKGWKVNFSSTYPLFKDLNIVEHEGGFDVIPIYSEDWKDKLAELSLLYGEHDTDKKFKGHGIKLDPNYKYQQFSVSKLAQYLVETSYKVETEPEMALPLEKPKRVYPPEPYTEINGLYENELMAAPMKAFLHGLGVKPTCMCITSLPLSLQYDALVNWDLKVIQINSVSSNYASSTKSSKCGDENNRILIHIIKSLIRSF
jgi:hypothetical protein